MDNPANYFKTYRLELGFSNQSDAKFFLAAKDITPDIDYAYITLLNERFTSIENSLAKIGLNNSTRANPLNHENKTCSGLLPWLFNFDIMSLFLRILISLTLSFF
jgi:hypothetical protein